MDYYEESSTLQNMLPEESNNIDTINYDTSIKHIVLAGGGTIILDEFSILKESNLCGFWNFKDIKTIYGTSAGGLLGLLICLLSIPEQNTETNSVNLDWDILEKYLIHRPWQNVFKIDILTIIQSINKDGILDINTIKESYSPIFKAKDLSMDINLKDFFELTNIEFHTFSVEINSFEITDISYKTHPDWTILEAVYASSALPILFSPFKKDNKIYADGGILTNYPLSYLFKNNPNINTDEILAINNNNIKIVEVESNIEIDTTTNINTYELDASNKSTNSELPPVYIYDTILIILLKMFEFIEKYNIINNKKIKYEVNIYNSYKNLLYNIYLASSSSEERKNLMNNGKDIWNNFISNYK